ncbi:hypothetical protein I6F37_38085 [Bradyrhizobium sp. NBAIM08]|nr:hypothetical protein [Bradyrhizobium sp. NBAIM08]
MAELDGELIAALPIDAGQAIADPFQPTAAAVELLHERLTELRSSAPQRGRLRRMWSTLRRTGPELAPR